MGLFLHLSPFWMYWPDMIYSFCFQVLYKEEFEKNKGKGFSVVSDTPELQRVKKTQDQISNVRALWNNIYKYALLKGIIQPCCWRGVCWNIIYTSCTVHLIHLIYIPFSNTQNCLTRQVVLICLSSRLPGFPALSSLPPTLTLSPYYPHQYVIECCQTTLWSHD